MTFRPLSRSFLPALLLAGILFGGCQATRNFTTYYNLFYNIERIMSEVEEELLYAREQKSGDPVFVVPYDEVRAGADFYDHLERRTMTAQELDTGRNKDGVPLKTKLDSIILYKGSKLLARDAKSDYVDDALYYIGKSYFYKREWYLSQKKCQEVIANFPESNWQPDAHLLLSMDLMHQGRIDQAEQMLSRTVDIAWGWKRRDVLIEAYRLNADIALGNGEPAKAIEPYYRAMTLTRDNADLARWQFEIGLIHFRQGEFEQALRNFDSVDEYSPEILVEFQNGLQRAAALRALGRYEEAEEQLDDLGSNTNYEDWWGLVEAERGSLAGNRSPDGALSDSLLAHIDSVSPGKSYSSYIRYEQALSAFRRGDYKTALEGFSKTQTATAGFQRRARQYTLLLTRYFEQSARAESMGQPGFDNTPDSVHATISDLWYDVSRVFVGIDRPDSVRKYYTRALDWAPAGSVQRARSLYAMSMVERSAGDGARADTLLRQIADDPTLSTTEYAAEARRVLNYTDYAAQDPGQDLYLSGRSFASIGQYARAVEQYRRVPQQAPSSPFVPRALYAIGLLYERELGNADSALYYYRELMRVAPESEQAADVRAVIHATNLQRSQRSADSARPADTNSGEMLIPLNDAASVPASSSASQSAPANGPSGTFRPVPQNGGDLRPQRPVPAAPRQP